MSCDASTRGKKAKTNTSTFRENKTWPFQGKIYVIITWYWTGSSNCINLLFHESYDKITLTPKCLWVLSHLDDNQTELTLQQEKEALADAVNRVSSLKQINPKSQLLRNFPSDLQNVSGCLCVSDLLYELYNADTFSLVEGDRTAQTVELSGEPQRRQTFSFSIETSSSGIAECFPWTLRRVKRVQSDAVDQIPANQYFTTQTWRIWRT